MLLILYVYKVNCCSHNRTIGFTSPSPVHTTKTAENSTLQYEGNWSLFQYESPFLREQQVIANNNFDVPASFYRIVIPVISIVIPVISIGETFHQWTQRGFFLNIYTIPTNAGISNLYQ